MQGPELISIPGEMGSGQAVDPDAAREKQR